MELPIKDCNVRVTVGDDGVWIHLKAGYGKKSMGFHVGNMFLDDKGEHFNVRESAVADWIKDRQNQAELFNVSED